MLQRYFILFLLVFPFSLSAQDGTNDTQAIIKTIENYFNGYIERDSAQLYQAFDTQHGTMKVPTSKTADGVTAYENKYFKDILPKWSSRDKLPQEVLDNSALKILNIDINHDKMATAKIEMKVGDTIYIDILSIQKMGLDWKITNKMYVVLE